MIQINLEAKPFNPLEEIVGTELTFMFPEMELVGARAIFKDVPEGTPYEILASYSDVGIDAAMKQFEALDYDVEGYGGLDKWTHPDKPVSFLCGNVYNTGFYQMKKATEVLKYLALVDKIKIEDIEVGHGIYDILYWGKTIKDGELVEPGALNKPKPKPIKFAGQFAANLAAKPAQWHPEPMDAIDEELFPEEDGEA